MIYFDNSATTLQKPASVGEAVHYAINNFGNPSRSFNECALLAAREMYRAREEIATLIKLSDPLKVAFTSSATESLNLVINGLIDKEDHVITTVLDHNAVLRPLYNTGCQLSFVDIDGNGKLVYDNVETLINEKTKAIICTHASNVTGEIVDVKFLKELAKKHNLLLILDVSQSIGCFEFEADIADILCFTGHKSMFGPQGTGGIITNDELDLKRIIKTGGSGSSSFEHLHSLVMPDLFEVGTPNAHGIYGLQKGVSFINEVGINKIYLHKKTLVEKFVNGLKEISGIKIYGHDLLENNVGVIALNYRDVDSNDFAQKLYEGYGIATRAAFHCAPLVHEVYQTTKQGMVRFSFSYFNTITEIERCLEAIETICAEYENNK